MTRLDETFIPVELKKKGYRSALLKPHIHNLKFSDVFFLRSHDRKHKFTHSKTRFATSVPDSKSHPTFVFLDFVVGVCFGNANCQEQ